jgi:hypothetical protein
VTAGTHLRAAVDAEARAYQGLLAGDDAGELLRTARDEYLSSHKLTGPASWGRLLGGLKMAILAGDGVGETARCAVTETEDAGSPAAAYVRALALVALGRIPDPTPLLDAGPEFARSGRALAAIVAGDRRGYEEALREILDDFESREQHLTGVAFADTAAVLERLAEPRGIAVHPVSALLPASRSGGDGRYTASPTGL